MDITCGVLCRAGADAFGIPHGGSLEQGPKLSYRGAPSHTIYGVSFAQGFDPQLPVRAFRIVARVSDKFQLGQTNAPEGMSCSSPCLGEAHSNFFRVD